MMALSVEVAYLRKNVNYQVYKHHQFIEAVEVEDGCSTVVEATEAKDSPATLEIPLNTSRDIHMDNITTDES